MKVNNGFPRHCLCDDAVHYKDITKICIHFGYFVGKFNLRLTHFYTRLHFAGPSVSNNSDEDVYLFRQEMMKTTLIYPSLMLAWYGNSVLSSHCSKHKK